MKPITCAKCNKEISEGDLVECPYCWEAYHTECWLETANCTNCQKFNMDFARARAEKEREEAEKIAIQNEFSGAEIEEDDNSIVHMPSFSVADSVASVSKIVLIVSIVFGILFAVYMFIANGVVGLIIGAIAGVGIATLGWVLSVLINGFAELIHNSHKSAEFLANLAAKNESEEN